MDPRSGPSVRQDHMVVIIRGHIIVYFSVGDNVKFLHSVVLLYLNMLISLPENYFLSQDKITDIC